MNLWVKLDKEPFPLETQFSNFGPIKSVYFCVALWGKKKITLKTKKKTLTKGQVVTTKAAVT